MNQQPPPHVPPSTLERRLANSRRDADLTQDEIADELGLSTRMIHRYEKGTHVPSRGTLLAWAQITNVDFAWLMGEAIGATIPADLAERRKRERRQARRGGAQVVTHLKAGGRPEGTEGVTIENPPAYRWAAMSHLVAA